MFLLTYEGKFQTENYEKWSENMFIANKKYNLVNQLYLFQQNADFRSICYETTFHDTCNIESRQKNINTRHFNLLFSTQCTATKKVIPWYLEIYFLYQAITKTVLRLSLKVDRSNQPMS